MEFEITSLLYFILALWILVALVYSLNRKLIGKLGKWLHASGWLNEWSMFTRYPTEGDNFIVVYREKGGISKWKKLVFLSTNPLGVDQRLNYFVASQLKRLKVAKIKGRKIEKEADYVFLTAVLGDYLNSEKDLEFKLKLVTLKV